MKLQRVIALAGVLSPSARIAIQGHGDGWTVSYSSDAGDVGRTGLGETVDEAAGYLLAGLREATEKKASHVAEVAARLRQALADDDMRAIEEEIGS